MGGSHAGTFILSTLIIFLVVFTIVAIVWMIPRFWGKIEVEWEREPDSDCEECPFCQKTGCNGDDCLTSSNSRSSATPDRWSGVSVGPCIPGGNNALSATAANAEANARAAAAEAAQAAEARARGMLGAQPTGEEVSVNLRIGGGARMLARGSVKGNLARTAIGHRIGVNAHGTRQRGGKRSRVGKKKLGVDRYTEVREAHTRPAQLAQRYHYPARHLSVMPEVMRRSFEMANTHLLAAQRAHHERLAPGMMAPLLPPPPAVLTSGARGSGGSPVPLALASHPGRSVGAYHSPIVATLSHPVPTRFTSIDDVERYVYSQNMDMFGIPFTGRAEDGHKGLVIGINYNDSPPDIPKLKNCINDAQLMMREYAIRHLGVTKPLLLTDDTPVKPTRENLLWALLWLFFQPSPGQKLFVHNSTHGTNILDEKGRERDRAARRIEVLASPLDRLMRGVRGSGAVEGKGIMEDDMQDSIITIDGLRITDAELYEFVRLLDSTDARLSTTNDSCRNATLWSIPYLYSVTPDLTRLREEKRHALHEPLNCNVISISACRDDEDAEDAPKVMGRDRRMRRAHNGAFTRAFIRVLHHTRYQCTLERLAVEVQRILATEAEEDGSYQHIQISSMRRLDLATPLPRLFAATSV